MKVTYENVKPLVEALKEFGRIGLLAVIPVVIEQLSEGKFEWRAVFVVGAIAVLRGVDKFMHLTGKVEGNETLTGGLTRF
jgi:hypothetical protein